MELKQIATNRDGKGKCQVSIAVFPEIPRLLVSRIMCGAEAEGGRWRRGGERFPINQLQTRHESSNLIF